MPFEHYLNIETVLITEDARELVCWTGSAVCNGDREL